MSKGKRVDVDLGNFVRQARMAIQSQSGEPKPTVEDFAKAADMSRQSWNNLESGNWPMNPSDALMRSVAKALNRSYEEIWLKVYESRIPSGLMVVPRMQKE